MNESYQEKVSKEFKQTDPERFGDASLTAAEFGALRRLRRQSEDSQAALKNIMENGYPLPDEITEKDLANAGARHACGVTEHLTKTRGEGAKEDTYESYTIKNRFDRFVWKNLPECLKKEWKSSIERESGYQNGAISYPDGVDEKKIHGGALPHRILPAQTMKNLELARLGKLGDKTLQAWGVDDGTNLKQFAIEWDKLIPVIQDSKTLLGLIKNLMNGIRKELKQNGVADRIINNIIETGFRTNGFKWEHGNFEGVGEYDFLTVKPGDIYTHEAGLDYHIDSVEINISDHYDEEIHDVTGYERGREPEVFNVQEHIQDELNEYVLYTQLEAGKYPAGKKWVRRKDDFVKHFVKSQ